MDTMEIIIDRSGNVRGDFQRPIGYAGDQNTRAIHVIHPTYSNCTYELLYSIRRQMYISRLDSNDMCVLKPSITSREGRIDMQFIARSTDDEILFQSKSFQVVIGKSIRDHDHRPIFPYEDALEMYKKLDELTMSLESLSSISKISDPTPGGVLTFNDTGEIIDSQKTFTNIVDHYSTNDMIPTAKSVFDLLTYNVNMILPLIEYDFVIEPNMYDITEKLIIKSVWAHAYSKYCVYAGSTPFTDEPVPITKGTVTAESGFEGNNITVKFFREDGSEAVTTSLRITNLGGKKIGKFEKE